MHIKTVILLVNFSFVLINFINLSSTCFIQRFLTFFNFLIKNAFLTFFILGVNVFYIYGFLQYFCFMVTLQYFCFIITLVLQYFCFTVTLQYIFLVTLPFFCFISLVALQ